MKKQIFKSKLAIGIWQLARRKNNSHFFANCKLPIAYFVIIANCQLSFVNCFSQNIGINTSGNTPDVSAGLDVSFNNKGLLIPRMALTGINDATTIATPANSLLIYHNGSVGLPTAGYYYNSGTSGAPVWTIFSTGSGSGWLTTGNNGTLSGTNFLGTIDNQDLDIRTFNTLKLRVSTKGQLETFGTTAPDNILIGEGAGETQTTGAGTIFLGKNSGYWSQNAIHTVAIGNEALFYNTVGDYNVSIGSYSMHGSSTNSSGTNNVAVGYYAMYNGPNKTENTAIGYNAMYGNINGDYNVAVGSQALYSTCGLYNTAIGWQALDATTSSATFNTATGKSALGANTDGTYNTAFGANALLTNTTGTYNTAIGNGADVSAVGLTNATAIGNGAIVSASNSLVLGNAANVGIGSASPAFKLDVNGAIRTGQNATDGQLLIYSEQGVTDYTYTINPNVAATQNVVFTLPPDDGAANQVLQTDGAGALTWVASGGGGDITDVIAGNGLTGGGATGSVTVTAVGDNGLTTNADDIDLGGTLNQATTITQGTNAMIFDLTNTGDFEVRDAGATAFFIKDDGNVGIGTPTPTSLLDITKNSIATAQSDAYGLSLVNTTAATAVTPQYSPAIRWRGNGWKTQATAASQPVDFRAFVVPLEGFSNPAGGLAFQAGSNGGAYSTLMHIINDATYGGELAIGDFTNPEAAIEIRKNYNATVNIRAYNDAHSFGEANLCLQTMGGTPAAPTASVAGDRIGSIDFRGGFGISPSGTTVARIDCYTPVNWSGTTRGGDLRFYTINTIAGGAAPERMRISGDGLIGINNTNPLSGRLNISHDYDVTGAGARPNHIYLDNPANTNLKGYIGLNLNTAAGANLEYLGIEVVEEGVHWANVVIAEQGGNVGIGTNNPTVKLHVNGDACVNHIGYVTQGACSDQRYKKDIVPLTDALSNVLKLQGLNYYWKQDEFPDKQFSADKQIGFIAQEIEKLYPEIVMTDDKGYKSVDYSRLTPVLVEAIKEQQKIIDNQQSTINNLQTSNVKQDARIKNLEELMGLKTEK